MRRENIAEKKKSLKVGCQKVRERVSLAKEGVGRSGMYRGRRRTSHILHVANSSDRLSMFTANLLVVEMGIWGGGGVGWMNKNKTK